MQRLIDHAHSIFRAAVRRVQPDRLVQYLNLEALVGKPLAAFKEIQVVGAGKAAMALAGALEAVLTQASSIGLSWRGHVVVPGGYTGTLPATQQKPSVISVAQGGHPMPNAASVRQAESALKVAQRCGVDTLLLVLLSGGGSALWCAPAAGISLADLAQINSALLRSGADIHAMNTVRKHCSRIKGGHLAAAACPASVLTLAISDVPGDDESVIASGPTVGDPTTYADAQRVLQEYRLWHAAPASIKAHLCAGLQGAAEETPKPGAAVLQGTHFQLIGSNSDALRAAALHAAHLGYEPAVRFEVAGEARMVGRALAESILRQPPRTCLLWGGETTVTVTGSGVGGRNHEVALAAAIALEQSERGAVVFSGGTDGMDGPTGAAGAWATPRTAERAQALGMNPSRALAENDSFALLDVVGMSLTTGPTHTNVMDVMVALVS